MIKTRAELREANARGRVQDRDVRRTLYSLQNGPSRKPDEQPATTARMATEIKSDKDFEYFAFEELYRGNEADIRNLELTLDGRPVTVVASCLGDGDTGGGLLYHDGQTWISIDDVSTSGLYVFNNELIRVLWAPSQVATGTSILHYTEAGYARHVTVDSLTDPHDVLWDGQQYVAVSSLQDSVFWVTPEGAVTKRFQPASGDDCWHLNSLVKRNGDLYASAFGRFDQPRGWVDHKLEGTGILFRLDTGEDVLTGPCCPHTPRYESNRWIVCNSASSELTLFTASGELIKRVQLQNWVRGIAVTDHYVLVGESVNRQQSSDLRGATVAILDRETWTVRGRLNLPYREVYDLGTGVTRTIERHRNVSKCAIDGAVPAADFG